MLCIISASCQSVSTFPSIHHPLAREACLVALHLLYIYLPSPASCPSVLQMWDGGPINFMAGGRKGMLPRAVMTVLTRMLKILVKCWCHVALTSSGPPFPVHPSCTAWLTGQIIFLHNPSGVFWCSSISALHSACQFCPPGDSAGPCYLCSIHSLLYNPLMLTKLLVWPSTQCGCCKRSWHRFCWKSSLQFLLLRKCSARETRVLLSSSWELILEPFPSSWGGQTNSKHFWRPSHLDTVPSAPLSLVHNSNYVCLLCSFQVARCTCGFSIQVFMMV